MQFQFFDLFFRTLAAQEDIEGLPGESLVLYRADQGDQTVFVQDDTTNDLKLSLIKTVARLQTLIAHTDKKIEECESRILSLETNLAPDDTSENFEDSELFTNDYADRVSMLERLIIECVRSILPDEAERFLGFRYRTGAQGRKLCLYRIE